MLRFLGLVIFPLSVLSAEVVIAAGGSLTFRLEDETSEVPVISRVEFYRGAAPTARREKQMPIRHTVSAGVGVVVDREVVLDLPDGPYHFRIVRGPEYRVIGGAFELEKTSLDEKTVALPRMCNMLEEGWVSGDCCVVASSNSLPLRMASEDLHVAAVLGDVPAKPIPRRDASEPIEHEPTWIRSDATHQQGLVFYGGDQTSLKAAADSFEAITSVGGDTKIAIEDPFAWELPVWLASRKMSGFFLMGDWLRLDRPVLNVSGGRGLESFSLREGTQVGRYAETIYRHLLECGLRVVPLAGGGSRSSGTPVGYNRMYVSLKGDTADDVMDVPTRVSTAEQWWSGIWQGNSVATNGPMLRPLVGGKLPGHVFRGSAGEVLQLQVELNLAVRDPVDYLEVIHNNQVHYSARLDEFARAGGKIPAIDADESGWVIIRVLTQYEEHYRAAVSAPWWIEIDQQRRVNPSSVAFFQDWLGEYEEKLKRLPPNELMRFVPYVRAARKFWEEL